MSLEQEIEQFIRQNFFYEGPALEPSASLMERGIIDSTGVLELVGFIEEKYGVTVDDTDLVPENLDGLGRISAFVERKRAEARV